MEERRAWMELRHYRCGEIILQLGRSRTKYIGPGTEKVNGKGVRNHYRRGKDVPCFGSWTAGRLSRAVASIAANRAGRRRLLPARGTPPNRFAQREARHEYRKQVTPQQACVKGPVVDDLRKEDAPTISKGISPTIRTHPIFRCVCIGAVDPHSATGPPLPGPRRARKRLPPRAAKRWRTPKGLPRGYMSPPIRAAGQWLIGR